MFLGKAVRVFFLFAAAAAGTFELMSGNTVNGKEKKMQDLVLNRSNIVAGLPGLLDGVASPADWMNRRRLEIRRFFEDNFFGKVPPQPEKLSFVIEKEVPCFDGLGIRREVLILMEGRYGKHQAKALWYLPASASAENPVPLVCGLNFKGNAACTSETDVPLDDAEGHGVQTGRWQIPYLLEQGISLITAPRNHFFPDEPEGSLNSIFKLSVPAEKLAKIDRSYTAISAWAWGCSRLLDLGLSDPAIDRDAVWVHGHSRLGKTALWAGANDSRFSGVVSNDSGCCGAAIARDPHPKSEMFASIAKVFTWWFVPAFDRFAGHDSEQDFDMHFLSALTAPRPLLIASASEDVWADPFNEFRATLAVTPLYRFLGAAGMPDDAQFPAPDNAVIGDKVAYELREGIHDVQLYDWQVVVEYIRKNRIPAVRK